MVIVLRCKRASQNSSADSEEKHKEQRRKASTSTCGLPDKKQRKYVVRRRSNYVVKLWGMSRDVHSVPSSAGVVL